MGPPNKFLVCDFIAIILICMYMWIYLIEYYRDDHRLSMMNRMKSFQNVSRSSPSTLREPRMWSGAVFHLVLLHASCRERSVVVFLYRFTKFIPFSRTVIGGGPPFHRLESHISFKHSRWPTLFPKNVTRSLQTYVYLNPIHMEFWLSTTKTRPSTYRSAWQKFMYFETWVWKPKSQLKVFGRWLGLQRFDDVLS